MNLASIDGPVSRTSVSVGNSLACTNVRTTRASPCGVFEVEPQTSAFPLDPLDVAIHPCGRSEILRSLACIGTRLSAFAGVPLPKVSEPPNRATIMVQQTILLETHFLRFRKLILFTNSGTGRDSPMRHPNDQCPCATHLIYRVAHRALLYSESARMSF